VPESVPVIQNDPVSPDDSVFTQAVIRLATVDDAAAAAAVMNAVIAERQYTVFDRPFSVEEERAFIASLGERQALFVAEVAGQVVALQSMDLFFPLAGASMRHVGTLGTWLLPEARGRGLGRRMASQSVAFARDKGYEKLVVFVIASNRRARRFYEALGFREIGVARRHVRLGDTMHDEVYLEVQLADVTIDQPSSG
jgi:L-amino acid N-acyltransferase YncA